MRPRRIARSFGWALTAVTATLPFALACGANAGATHDGGITGADAFGPAYGDGAAADSGAAVDGGTGVRGPEANPADRGAFASECLDGRDQNGGDGLDCSDDSCAQAPSCCVGRTSAGCCTVPGPALTLDFACASAPCDGLDGLTTFGDVGPVRADDGAFAPESDHGTDSGAIAPDDLDPRASMVTLRATLGAPTSTEDVDAVGIGLVAGGPSAHLVPTAAVVVSAARHQTLLLLGETVAAVLPAPVDDALYPYTLTIDPSGHVVASDGTHTMEADVELPPTPLHAVFFGRATNPGSSAHRPARIGSFSVTSAGCDQPAALTRLGAISIADHTGSSQLGTLAHPSIASDGTTTVMAFAATTMLDPTHSAIFVAVRETDGAFHVRAATGPQPVLTPASGESFESPAIAYVSGAWVIFATRVHDGTRSIVHARSTTSDPMAYGAAADVAAPALLGELSAPAIVPESGGTQLVARLQPPPTEMGPSPSELVLMTFEASDVTATPAAGGLCAAEVACEPDAREENHLYAARTTVLAFDSDEVADPAVVLIDHVYRLYYAGRRGSRWSIGMLIAADLGYWRAANQGSPILAPDGEGLDAVSVRSPAPIVEDGRLSLYYLASDGDVTTFALARGGAVRSM